MSEIDTVNCIVCLEKKATNFCITCRKSSGVCQGCYTTLNEDTYGGIGSGGDYLEPIKCLICKHKMHHSVLMQNLWIDLFNADDFHGFQDYVTDDKKEKLLKIVYENCWETPYEIPEPAW